MRRLVLPIALIAILLLPPFSQGEPAELPAVHVLSIREGRGIPLLLYAAENRTINILYDNITIHIFAETGARFSVLVNDGVYVRGFVGNTSHEVVHIDASNMTTFTLFVTVEGREFDFGTIRVLHRPIYSTGKGEAEGEVIVLPVWEYIIHDWYVALDTAYGGFLAIFFSSLAAKWIISRRAEMEVAE